jgi:UbiD family decarboxylase
MRFRNLKSFIQELQRTNQLVVIDEPVDANQEIAEIHRRVIAANGPALLFRKVKGKRFPVATNLFGTKERVDLAFSDIPKNIVRRISQLPHELLPPSLKKVWAQRDLASPLLRVGIRQKRGGPVTANRLSGDQLLELPALTSWPEDGGPFLTLPLVNTMSVTGKPENLGMYRIQLHGPSETGAHFQIGKGGGFHLWEAEQRNVPLPTNIYLGGPPALILAAIAPLPENVPEMLLASLVQGERLDRSSVAESALAVVSEAEFALVGEVPPGVRRPEGPFGDHYGYYSLRHDYPVFRPKCIYHRDDAIYPATVVGKPRQEDLYIGDYLQELLLPMIPVVMPSIVDLWSYGETGFHSLTSAVVRERYARECMGTGFRILGEGQLTLTKFLMLIDRPMDLRNFRQVLTYLLERADWVRDLFVFSEVSMDTLDYAGPEVNKGSKGIMVGVGEARRALPSEMSGDVVSGVIRDARVFSPGCLVIQLPAFEREKIDFDELLRQPALQDWPLIVAVDNVEKATYSDAAFLWTTFTRFEPAADIHIQSDGIARHRPRYRGPLLIDARMKPWYPKELFCDPEVARQVSDRWLKYFPAGKVVMGDSDYGHVGPVK